VQQRHATAHTSGEYVTEEGWRAATLERCPLHAQGGCGFARHTPYARVEPPGMRVARNYCPAGRTTFSLLPDCLASRLSSTLAEVEQVVVGAERAPTVEQAARQLRPDIGLQGAVRWVRRRQRLVRIALLAIVTLMAPEFGNVTPTVTGLRMALSSRPVLVRLREVTGVQLRSLPPPLGLGPRTQPRRSRQDRFQHEAGADPPGGRR
jgi:hypothetical protein